MLRTYLKARLGLWTLRVAVRLAAAFYKGE